MVAEEGSSELYGDLSAHFLPVIPNAVAMCSTYELVIGWGGEKQPDSAP